MRATIGLTDPMVLIFFEFNHHVLALV